MNLQTEDGQPSSLPERHELLDSAARLAAEGKTHDAIAVYQRMLASNPQDTEVIGRLADMYSHLAANIRKTLGEEGST